MAVDLTSIIVELADRGVGVDDIRAVATAATDVDNDYDNDGNVVALVVNDSAGVRIATLKSQADSQGRGGVGNEENDEVINIPAGEIGFFPFANAAGFTTGRKSRIVLDAFLTTGIALYRLRKLR